MAIQIFASIVIAAGICLAALAIKTLLVRGWFVKWLRGTSGFAALVVTVFGGVIALDLLTYYKSQEGEVLATLKFNQLAEQQFDVELVGAQGRPKSYQLWGDQWQLDVRLIRLQGLFTNDLPSYKLDRLSGRYLSLEQEKNSQRSVFGFIDDALVDTWPWMLQQKWLSIIQAKNGSAAFMPMADGAIYEVRLYKRGLLATPVNEQAKLAVEAW